MSIDPKNTKILLAEDSPIMRKIELKTMKSLGFDDILEAGDGKEAVAILEQEKIDLIVSDWNMPNMSGFELLQWVRKDEKCKNIPFIMATGQGDKQQEHKAIDAGVSSFVAKPFNADELKSKIDEAFGIKSSKTEASQDTAPKVTKSGKVRLKVAHIQITDHLILGVVKHWIEKGKISPKHFELEVQCMAGWNPVQDALEAGSIDMAFILAPIAMDLFSFDVPIKMILLAHKNGSIFVHSKQGAYSTPYQNFFKKKRFLLPHKMSIHHLLAHVFFNNIGLKADMSGGEDVDVTFDIVAPIKMPEFLSGNADSCGFMVAEPIGTKAIATNVAELQFLSSELWENHPCCVVAARDDFIKPYSDATHEFVEMLVEAGKFIEQKPEIAAEIAVSFLDPKKQLGLKVPILKNVLKEPKGIKTNDLFPNIEELDQIQQYMVNKMGIGSLIDLEKFVDTQFAETACKDRISSSRPSRPHDSSEKALYLLERQESEAEKTSKTMLAMEGKYLTFALAEQEFGINILKIKEIIGAVSIRSIPQTPYFIKGVINLRGKVIPVMDLKMKFGMEETILGDRSCIIVLEIEVNEGNMLIGVTVDSVSEVIDIKASDMELTPSFGIKLDTSHILGMAKVNKSVKLLLDISNVLKGEDIQILDKF